MNMRSCNCCLLDNIELQEISDLSQMLKLLAEENRLKIFCLLEKGNCRVCEMHEPLVMSQSLLSHHLADLKSAGLINSRKKGRKVHYFLTKKGKKINQLLNNLRKEL